MLDADVVFTPAAERDLDDIWFDIARLNPIAADQTIDNIRKRTEQLGRFPESGPLRPEISETARSLTEGNHLIFYALTNRRVEIVRIVHGARDLANLL